MKGGKALMNIDRPDLIAIDRKQRARRIRRRNLNNGALAILLTVIMVTLLCIAVCKEIDYRCSAQLPQTKIADQSPASPVDEQTTDQPVDRGNVAGREPAEMQSLGTFEVTYYTNSVADCGKMDGVTSSGTVAQINHTIATDPRVVPTGTEIMIDGQIYTAEDTGGAIKGKRIDVFVGSDQEARQLGRTEKEVFLIREELDNEDIL
jgi:3D (Asp-Asp-Asp) domain-containing protein